MGERTLTTAKSQENRSDSSVARKARTDSSAPLHSPEDLILHLQRTVGNQAVGSFLRSGSLQAKLTIGQPNDRYEQEADRVAERVMRMPDPIPSLTEGIVEQHGRRTRKRVLESVEGLLPGTAVQRQAVPVAPGRGSAVPGASPPSAGTQRTDTAVAPFYVSFQNARPPVAPDHSPSSPGSGGAGANRAGITRVHVAKRMTIAWDNGPARADGKLPFFAQSVNIFFRLDPIEVFVSEDYDEGSCPYNVTLQHEQSHVEAFIRIFHSCRQRLIQQLNTISVPTESSPELVLPAEISALQDSIAAGIAEVIRTTASQLVADMEADRNAKDSSSSYAAVYGRCPAGQWNP